MEILLDNPLATLYGPYFLILYGFVIFFSLIALAIVKQRIDQTDKLNLPPIPQQIDPYEIAYLRGGINEVARSVVFSLLQKRFIEIKHDGKTTEIIRINNDNFNLSEIEKRALNWFHSTREPKELFDTPGLITELEKYAEMYEARLERQQLLAGDEMQTRFKPWKLGAYLLILGLCLYKLLAALANGYTNVIFLTIFGIVGMFVAFRVARLPRVTKLGKKYLERLQLTFENLKNQSQSSPVVTSPVKSSAQPAFAGVDPVLLSVGVFGGAALAGTMYDGYNQAFQRAQTQTSAGGCGSACGTECSGGSASGDGGSSCSSGCGGCGGGCS